MPNIGFSLPGYIQTGNPDTFYQAVPTGASAVGSFAPYALGELGMTFDFQDKRYTNVLIDSGATSATPTGAPTANQLLFWKDKAAKIVTNDRRFALGNTVAQASCNQVAGVLRVTPSGINSGQQTFVCALTAGYAISVKAGTVSGLGQILVADTDANGPQCLGTAVGTAPSYLPIGVSRAAASGGNVSADVNITTIA